MNRAGSASSSERADSSRRWRVWPRWPLRPSGLSLCVALTLILACATPPRTSFPPQQFDAALSARLLSSSQLAGDQVLRQRLHFRFAEETGVLDAVVQVDCGVLRVIGLSPIGSRLFVIEQRGLEVTLETTTQRQLPFSARNLLLDVQRTYLYPLSDPAPADGRYRHQQGVTTLHETWRGGRLRERVIADSNGERKGEIVVSYEGGYASSETPPRVHLDNRLYGYSLDVQTLEKRVLEPSGEGCPP